MKVSIKYTDFANIFSLDLMSKLLKHSGINDYTIKIVDSQQPLYRPIYRLEPVELKILKAFIETNLANEFIRSSKLPTSSPIFFD